MAEEEFHVTTLRDTFYRDSFGRVTLVIALLIAAILILFGFSVYLHFAKPKPTLFAVYKDMRVVAPVPLDQPYLTTPEVLQWVADVFPKSFNYDFNHYNDQLASNAQYFTAEGWKIFLNQLNIYVNYNNVQSGKLFVTGVPTAAPTFLNKGILPNTGQYGWWVRIPVRIDYAGYQPPASQTLTWQVLVVRVPTLDNLTGVGIQNIVLAS